MKIKMPLLLMISSLFLNSASAGEARFTLEALQKRSGFMGLLRKDTWIVVKRTDSIRQKIWIQIDGGEEAGELVTTFEAYNEATGDAAHVSGSMYILKKDLILRSIRSL